MFERVSRPLRGVPGLRKDLFHREDPASSILRLSQRFFFLTMGFLGQGSSSHFVQKGGKGGQEGRARGKPAREGRQKRKNEAEGKMHLKGVEVGNQLLKREWEQLQGDRAKK